MREADRLDVRGVATTDVGTDAVADAELLRAGRAAVKVAVIADRAVSYGVGTPADAGYLRRAVRCGVPIVPRTSGGTGVLLGPGDLTWALVLPRGDRRVGRGFVRAYDRLGQGIVDALDAHGVDAAWGPPLDRSPECCLLGGRGRVLRVGDRVVGGAAQHLTGSALLHHGVVLAAPDRALGARVFDLARADADRLVGTDALGVPGPRSAWAHAVAEALARSLDDPR